MFRGRVVGLYVTHEAGAPMQARDEVEAVTGVGLVGDRYARPRDVTLIEREAIAGVVAEYDVELAEAETRRNIVVEGVPLNHLVGQTFRVGEVVLRGDEMAEPCTYLEGLTRPGVRAPLVHRGGLRAEVMSGGTIRIGDPVDAADAAVRADEVDPD
jgi:MOSC domain-containing protein YiiM